MFMFFCHGQREFKTSKDHVQQVLALEKTISGPCPVSEEFYCPTLSIKNSWTQWALSYLLDFMLVSQSGIALLAIGNL